jgi:hypothetical protein
MRTIVFDLILSILLISPSSIMAPLRVSAQETPRSSSSREHSPNKWNEYTSERGRFRIRFPGKPKEESSPVDVHFLSYSGLLEFRVSYTDEPELSGNLDSANKYLEEMKVATEAIAKVSNERIVSQKKVTIDGYPGYFTYVQTAKGWVRDLQLVVGNRVYTIVVEGRKGQANEAAEKNDFERVAMAFINSFKVIPPSSKPNTRLQRTRQ